MVALMPLHDVIQGGNMCDLRREFSKSIVMKVVNK